MQNLLSFFEDAPESFWIIDQNHRLVYGNKSFFISYEQIYGSSINYGDDILHVIPEISDHYLFWKNSYEKAFQFKQYSIELAKGDPFYKVRTKFDFRLIESLSKYICVRAISYDISAGEFNYSSASADNSEFTLNIDEDGNILRISPAVKNILGYIGDWMEGKTVVELLHPEEKDLLQNFFRSNESMEATWCRIRDYTGKYFWCNIQMAAFGKMQVDRKYVITINEIRIQKTPADTFVPDANILQIISEAQSQYINTSKVKTAFDICLSYFQNEGIAPFSFIARLDWEGTHPILKKISSSGNWGFVKEDSVKNLLDILAERCYEIQKGINNNVQQEISNVFIIQFEGINFMMYLLLQKDEIIGVLVTSNMILASKTIPQVNPKITYFRPLFVSILQSGRFIMSANIALRKLAVSKDELQSLVASLDDIILEVNTNLAIVNVWCNNDSILSTPKELMIGKRITDIKGEELGKKFEVAIQIVLEIESSHSIEYMDSYGGKIEWFSAKMNLVKMFNGEKRVSILIQDITQRKEAEIIIEETLKKEKDLNEMKSKMITSVSHEFRTPLATIVSSTELLEMHIKKDYGQISPRAGELLENIYEESERISDMLRNFLVMGRFEENQMPFKPKETDVVALVQRIIKTRFNSKYGEDKIKLKIKNEPKDVYIDPSLMWHIFSNLVSNAIKYSPEKSHVTVELEFLDNEFVLCVKDRGIGIPPEDLKNIFQTFYRAGNSDEHSGYGLGLSIVDRFVKMHDGRIEVTSKEGKGSTFKIHFDYNILNKIQYYEKDEAIVD